MTHRPVGFLFLTVIIFSFATVGVAPEGQMVRFFCPGCWEDFPDDFEICPECGTNTRAFWSGKDYVDRLIVALDHPVKSTVARAVWILGKLEAEKAVPPLISLIEKTKDIYLIRATARALGEIGTSDAMAFLVSLRDHPAKIVRDEVQLALELNGFGIISQTSCDQKEIAQ
ncbi:MAG: HEAT repeat domain-containing protein [Desulfomonilaceae bacterium]